MSNLAFEEQKLSPRKKTKWIEVTSTHSGDNLGCIYFYPKWRQYIWEQYEDVVMSADCLGEVMDKLAIENSKWRSGLKPKE